MRLSVLLILKNKFVFKDVLCPHLKCHDYNDCTTFVSFVLILEPDIR